MVFKESKDKVREIVKLGKIYRGLERTGQERIGQRGKESENFFGHDCPVLSNPPVLAKQAIFAHFRSITNSRIFEPIT